MTRTHTLGCIHSLTTLSLYRSSPHLSPCFHPSSFFIFSLSPVCPPAPLLPLRKTATMSRHRDLHPRPSRAEAARHGDDRDRDDRFYQNDRDWPALDRRQQRSPGTDHRRRQDYATPPRRAYRSPSPDWDRRSPRRRDDRSLRRRGEPSPYREPLPWDRYPRGSSPRSHWGPGYGRDPDSGDRRARVPDRGSSYRAPVTHRRQRLAVSPPPRRGDGGDRGPPPPPPRSRARPQDAKGRQPRPAQQPRASARPTATSATALPTAPAAAAAAAVAPDATPDATPDPVLLTPPPGPDAAMEIDASPDSADAVQRRRPSTHAPAEVDRALPEPTVTPARRSRPAVRRRPGPRARRRVSASASSVTAPKANTAAPVPPAGTLPRSADKHAVSRKQAHRSYGPDTITAGKLVGRIVKTIHHRADVHSFLKEGVPPPGYEATVDGYAAVFRPSSPTRESWAELRDATETWFRRCYEALDAHYGKALDGFDAALENLRDVGTWADAWELGVRWASADLGTTVSQATLHLAKAHLPCQDIYTQVQTVPFAPPVSTSKAVRTLWPPSATAPRRALAMDVDQTPGTLDDDDAPPPMPRATPTTEDAPSGSGVPRPDAHPEARASTPPPPPSAARPTPSSPLPTTSAAPVRPRGQPSDAPPTTWDPVDDAAMAQLSSQAPSRASPTRDPTTRELPLDDGEVSDSEPDGARALRAATTSPLTLSPATPSRWPDSRSEEHTSELQSR